MAAAAAFIMLSVLIHRPLPAFATKDCAVLVTGPNKPWTPERRLEWIPSAPSTLQQLPGQPPGRSEVSFSVLTPLSGLKVRLSSSRHPGGYLLHVGPDSWRVQRTFVGTVQATLDSGPAPAGHVLTPDEWSSYAIAVTRRGRVQLQRLYDNGTRLVWLEVEDTEPVPVDAVETRAASPQNELSTSGQGGGIGPVSSGHWGFWKFDCSRFYYQTADICHLWPSWPNKVPLRFRTPNLRISPVVNVNVLLNTSAVAELFLFETDERYYVITLTPSELTLGRAELGVPVVRQVARACLLLAPASAWFRLLWVSVLQGIISIGLDDARPCPEEAEQAPTTTAPPVPVDMTTETYPTGPDRITDATTALGEQSTTPVPGRTALITWHDGLAYYVLSYGVRTPTGQGVWTVNCQPDTDSVIGNDKWGGLAPRGVFNSQKPSETPAKPGTSSAEDDGGGGGGGGGGGRHGCPTSQPFLLATVVLSVVSVVLLLLAVVLASALIGQRRRRSAELGDQRRLSLASTDLFTMPPPAAGGEHEYAEMHLYDSIRPMSLQPGQSTFKPVRRQASLSQPDLTLEEVPVFEESRSSVEPLPPPPEGI